MFDDYDDYDDYEGYVTSRSEFDTVVSEAEQKIRGLFVERINNTIAEAREAENKLEKLQSEIRSLEYQKIQKEDDLKRAVEKLEKAELYDIPKKYIDKFVRNATKGLAPNDEVWVLKVNYERETCDCCNGTGKLDAIIAGKKEEINCTKCNGKKEIVKYIYSPKKTKVNNIQLKLCFGDDGKVRYWNTENIYVRGFDYYFHKDSFFLTEEEVQAEADRRNAKEK